MLNYKVIKVVRGSNFVSEDVDVMKLESSCNEELFRFLFNEYGNEEYCKNWFSVDEFKLKDYCNVNKEGDLGLLCISEECDIFFIREDNCNDYYFGDIGSYKLDKIEEEIFNLGRNDFGDRR